MSEWNTVTAGHNLSPRRGASHRVTARAPGTSEENAAASPHEPLFVLRQHRSSILSCSFFPNTATCNQSGSFDTAIPHTTTLCSPLGVPYFLSGDVDGVCLLWDLRHRKPVLSFEPVEFAFQSLWKALEETSSQSNRSADNVKDGDGEAAGSTDATTSLGTDTASSLKSEESKLRAKQQAFAEHEVALRGVLSVGFMPTGYTFRSQPFPAAPHSGSNSVQHRDPARLTVRQPQQHHHQPVEEGWEAKDWQCESSSVDSPSQHTTGAVAVTTSFPQGESTSDYSPRGVGLPQRFQLRRRPRPAVLGATTEAETCSPLGSSGHPSPTIDFAAEPTTAKEPLFFYTQCRNRKVYLWKCPWPEGNTLLLSHLTLVHTLEAPQIGFCQLTCAHAFLPPVEMGPTTRPDSTRIFRVGVASFFALPMESTQGELHVWSFQPEACELLDESVKPSSAAPPTAPAMSKTNEDEDEEEEEEERFVRNGIERRRGESVGGPPRRCSVVASVLLSSLHTPQRMVLRRLLPNLCSGVCLLNPDFKGGTIMCLHLCRDACRLVAGMESGHVVLYQFRDPSRCSENKRQPVPPHVVGVLRVFPEPCTACVWWWAEEEGAPEESSFSSMVFAGSAEGHVHGYHFTTTHHAEPSATPLWRLQWSSGLSKGIGQLRVEDGVVVAGCWDATVRLFGQCSGRVLSIFPQHRETVNALGLCDATYYANHHPPSTSPSLSSTDWLPCFTQSVREALTRFAFDPRQMRVAGGKHDASRSGGSTSTLHVLASGGKDYLVAVWVVDFEQIRLRRHALTPISSHRKLCN